MPRKSYDLFIMGCGPAGQSLAVSAVEAGLSVGICEATAFGGACPNRGCDPKKVHYAAAQAMLGIKRLTGKGFTDEPTVNWADLQRWKSTFTEHIPADTKTNLTGMGVDCYEGAATFTGPGKVKINNDTAIEASRVIIATGARPAPLDIPGKEYYLESAGFLEMEDLPKRVLFIGSGYIGSSFAQISAVLGAEVTVIASDDRPVQNFDDDLNDLLVMAAEAHGITIHFGTKARRIDRNKDGSYTVGCACEESEDVYIDTDRVIHCAGRVPNIEDIGLDKAGIKYDEGGISVDSKLCTSVSAHYAIGDCAKSGLPLTPVATYEARLLADNLFQGMDRETDFLPIPTVAFTLPPIAAVGMTSDQARQDDRDLTIKFEETTDWFSNRHHNIAAAGYKLVIDEKNDLILGAHLLGHNAEEVINLFAFAIHEEIPIQRIKHMVLAYPTSGADIKKMLG